MTAVLSPADASANVASVSGEWATKTKGRITHLAPGSCLLLDVQAVAEMLGCSTRHVYRLADSGRMPRPIKLGSLCRWSATAIQEWILAGCRPVCQVKGGAA
jgi:excisionase family DNA binding protein